MSHRHLKFNISKTKILILPPKICSVHNCLISFDGNSIFSVASCSGPKLSHHSGLFSFSQTLHVIVQKILLAVPLKYVESDHFFPPPLISPPDRTKYFLICFTVTASNWSLCCYLCHFVDSSQHSHQWSFQSMSDSVISLLKILQWLFTLIIHCLKTLYNLDFCDVWFTDSLPLSACTKFSFLWAFTLVVFSARIFFSQIMEILPSPSGLCQISFLNEAYPEHSI